MSHCYIVIRSVGVGVILWCIAWLVLHIFANLRHTELLLCEEEVIFLVLEVNIGVVQISVYLQIEVVFLVIQILFYIQCMFRKGFDEFASAVCYTI